MSRVVVRNRVSLSISRWGNKNNDRNPVSQRYY